MSDYMTAAEYSAGLRELADWVDTNAELLDEQQRLQPDSRMILFYATTPERLAEYVRLIGGGEKNGDDNYFTVTRRFGPITLQAYTSRENVCRKVTRTEMREVEVTEWECDDAILSHQAEAVAS